MKNSTLNWAPLTLPSAHAEWSINKAASATSYKSSWWIHKLSESWKSAHAMLRCSDAVLPLSWNWAFQPSLLLQIQRPFLALATTPAHTPGVPFHITSARGRTPVGVCFWWICLEKTNCIYRSYMVRIPSNPLVLKPSFFSSGGFTCPIKPVLNTIVRLVYHFQDEVDSHYNALHFDKFSMSLRND